MAGPTLAPFPLSARSVNVLRGDMVQRARQRFCSTCTDPLQSRYGDGRRGRYSAVGLVGPAIWSNQGARRPIQLLDHAIPVCLSLCLFVCPGCMCLNSRSIDRSSRSVFVGKGGLIQGVAFSMPTHYDSALIWNHTKSPNLGG